MTDGKRRLLLVEDESSVAEVVGKRLTIEGFEVINAVNGEEAVAKAQTERPDLIVLDLMLPKISGLKVCQRIKRDLQTQRIPVIIFTGKGEIVDERACRDSGADAYVMKTEGTAVLLEKIKSLLSQPQSS